MNMKTLLMTRQKQQQLSAYEQNQNLDAETIFD